MIYQISREQFSYWVRNNPFGKWFLSSNPPPPSPLEFSGAPTPPHPLGISNSLRGGGKDIFWSHTMRRPLILHETGLTRNRFFTSYLFDIEFSLGYLLFLFLNWFSMRVSNNQKNVCSHRLCVCINTGKGLAGEITSLSEIKKVIYMARPFNHRRK